MASTVARSVDARRASPGLSAERVQVAASGEELGLRHDRDGGAELGDRAVEIAVGGRDPSQSRAGQERARIGDQGRGIRLRGAGSVTGRDQHVGQLIAVERGALALGALGDRGVDGGPDLADCRGGVARDEREMPEPAEDRRRRRDALGVRVGRRGRDDIAQLQLGVTEGGERDRVGGLAGEDGPGLVGRIREPVQGHEDAPAVPERGRVRRVAAEGRRERRLGRQVGAEVARRASELDLRDAEPVGADEVVGVERDALPPEVDVRADPGHVIGSSDPLGGAVPGTVVRAEGDGPRVEVPDRRLQGVRDRRTDDRRRHGDPCRDLADDHDRHHGAHDRERAGAERSTRSGGGGGEHRSASFACACLRLGCPARADRRRTGRARRCPSGASPGRGTWT